MISALHFIRKFTENPRKIPGTWQALSSLSVSASQAPALVQSCENTRPSEDTSEGPEKTVSHPPPPPPVKECNGFGAISYGETSVFRELITAADEKPSPRLPDPGTKVVCQPCLRCSIICSLEEMIRHIVFAAS